MRGFRRAGADPRGPRRRPVHARDVLRPRGARDRDRGRPLGLAAADRRADELRQRRRDDGRGARAADAAGGCASSASTRSARTTAAARRRRSTALAEMAGDGSALAALPNVGLATFTGARLTFPHATPEYFARVRGASARARRPRDRRLLRHDAGPDRGDPRSASTRTARAADGSRAATARRDSRRAEPSGPTELPRLLAAGRVRRLGAARPAARRQRRRARRVGRGSCESGRRARRRRERQPAGTRAGMSGAAGLGRDPARDGDRGRPAPDAARLDARGPRVAAARRPRRRRAERARSHRRRAGAGRLSRAPARSTTSTRSGSSS